MHIMCICVLAIHICIHIYFLLCLFCSCTAGLGVWHQGQRVRIQSSWARTAAEGAKLAAVPL